LKKDVNMQRISWRSLFSAKWKSGEIGAPFVNGKIPGAGELYRRSEDADGGFFEKEFRSVIHESKNIKRRNLALKKEKE
jgi:hypothetical protein